MYISLSSLKIIIIYLSIGNCGLFFTFFKSQFWPHFHLFILPLVFLSLSYFFPYPFYFVQLLTVSGIFKSEVMWSIKEANQPCWVTGQSCGSGSGKDFFFSVESGPNNIYVKCLAIQTFFNIY